MLSTSGMEDLFSYNSTAEDAGDGAKARPGGITNQPEACHATIVWDGMLVCIV